MFSFLSPYKKHLFDDLPFTEVLSSRKELAKKNVYFISPIHGRSLAAYVDDTNWITIKGVGWLFGGPHILRSTKDLKLVFGLMDRLSADREYLVSEHLRAINPEAPEILECKTFSELPFSNSLQQMLVNIRYTNNEMVNPCLLLTKVKSPFRIADLSIFDDKQRKEILDFYCDFFKCAPKAFIQSFAMKLGRQIGLYHANNIINDSLSNDNITLCAEIVDYEWITVPGIPLPDGSDGSHQPTERKEKEIIYALEACMFLTAYLHLPYNFYEILGFLLDGYKKHHPEFIARNNFINRINSKEKIIC